MSALSDSTTTTLSPLESMSPSDLIQETILPSVMVELRAGMKISLILDRTVRVLRLEGNVEKEEGRKGRELEREEEKEMEAKLVLVLVLERGALERKEEAIAKW